MIGLFFGEATININAEHRSCSGVTDSSFYEAHLGRAKTQMQK